MLNYSSTKCVLMHHFSVHLCVIFLLSVGYQLTSAECFDMRSGRVVVDQYCHYYPENVKPKPKLEECNMEPCLARLETVQKLFKKANNLNVC